MNWFLSLDKTVQAALIGLCSAVLVAIITGVFSLLGKARKEKTGEKQSTTTTINQSSSGSYNTFIGIQNNGKEK